MSNRDAYPERVFIEVGGLTLHHLDGHNAKGPDVHFGAVSFAGHHFRSHPVGRTHHGAPFALLRSDLSTEAKVG